MQLYIVVLFGMDIIINDNSFDIITSEYYL